MGKTQFSGEELISKGFELVNDGGENYFQKVLDTEDFFTSDFLASIEVSDTMVSVQLNAKGDFLTEEQINNLIK